MLFTQLFEDDFNKKKLNEGVGDDDYEDCSYCSGTGEGRWEGSTCTHCRGSGVEPSQGIEDDDFEEPDDIADLDSDEESYYEKSLRSRGLGEGTNEWPNFGSRYAEQLAQKVFDLNPNLSTKGRADELLNAAFPIMVQDLGSRKRANYYFNYDEDFPSDFVSAYGYLQDGIAEGIFGSKQNPVVPLVNKISQVARQLTPQNVDTGKQIIQSNTDDILRIVNPQTKTGVEVIEQGMAEYGDTAKGQKMLTKVQKRAVDRMIKADDKNMLEPDYTKRDLATVRKNQATANRAWDRMTDKDIAESRMSELDAEYQDYKKLSPREFFNTYKTTKQAWFEKHKGFLKNISEADKKKEDEPEVRDVALQRAISRAKGDFPAAGSGLEALAKDFMRGQEQDQKSFDQLQRAERQQDQMLQQISKIDQEQEQEIQDLEQQNSTLAQRLQQLQNVNSKLEKKLAAMSGRKQKRQADKSEPVPTIASEPLPAATTPAAATQPEPEPKSEPTTSRAIGQVAKTLAPPTASPAFDRISQELQPRQKELGFDEPVTLEPKPRKYDTSRAADVDYRELTSKLARDIAADPDRARAFKPSAVKGVAGQQEMPVEGKEESARIRAVKRQRADGSVETTYELVNARGVTVKTGMSKDTALSHLKHYKQKYGQ